MGEFVTKSMWIGAIPLLLIGAADTFFAAAFAEAIPPAPVVYYTFLVWSGIAAVAALAVIPNVSVRWIVAALLLAAAIASSMTIGILYFPAAAAAAFAAWWESRAPRP